MTTNKMYARLCKMEGKEAQIDKLVFACRKLVGDLKLQKDGKVDGVFIAPSIAAVEEVVRIYKQAFGIASECQYQRSQIHYAYRITIANQLLKIKSKCHCKRK